MDDAHYDYNRNEFPPVSPINLSFWAEFERTAVHTKYNLRHKLNYNGHTINRMKSTMLALVLLII